MSAVSSIESQDFTELPVLNFGAFFVPKDDPLVYIYSTGLIGSAIYIVALFGALFSRPVIPMDSVLSDKDWIFASIIIGVIIGFVLLTVCLLCYLFHEVLLLHSQKLFHKIWNALCCNMKTGRVSLDYGNFISFITALWCLIIFQMCLRLFSITLQKQS